MNFRPPKIHREVWLYNQADWELINQTLWDAPWHLFGNYDSIDDILDYYYEILYTTIDELIPYREFIQRKKDKPWTNGYLRRLMAMRNRMNGVYKRTLRPDHKIVRNGLRAFVKVEIKRVRSRYNAGLKDYLNNRTTNIKRFWSIMKQLYGAKVKASIPTLIQGNNYYSSNIEKAEHFADYFAAQCSLPDPPDGFAFPPMRFLTNEKLENVDPNSVGYNEKTKPC